MGKIIIQNRAYSFEQIKNQQWSEPDLYFHQALTFCHQWLTSVQTFELSTSGSTGVPKTITVDRHQMEKSAAGTKAFFRIEQGSILLCCLNVWMIAGKMMLVRGLEWDATLYLVQPKENPLVDVPDFISFDFAAMVPMQVTACMNEANTIDKLKKIKTLIIGGAPSSPSLIQKITDFKLNAYQTYGMTETVSHIALAKITQKPLTYNCLPEVKVGTDEEGKLWIESPTAREKRLYTNDIAEVLNDSQFKWVGRSDFTINSGGIKLQPEILEPQMASTVEKIYGPCNFFLIGKEDEKLGEKMVMVLEQPLKDESQAQDLLNELKTVINRYHIPREILINPSFVKTASGKINRPATLKKAR